MELDDLRSAWQQVTQELQAQKRVTDKLLSERAGRGLERTLRPLFNWQVVQILIGILLAGVGGQFWVPRMGEPILFASGLIVHAYGVALIINGIRVVMRYREIDFGAPVMTLQKSVARLERSYVISGWILGLPWWLLWIPMAIVLLTWIGIDVLRGDASGWLLPNILVGIAGMALTLAFYFWARGSTRPGVRKRLARLVRGASLDRAQALLADIESFEQPTGQAATSHRYGDGCKPRRQLL